jgi:hypothetical protein
MSLCTIFSNIIDLKNGYGPRYFLTNRRSKCCRSRKSYSILIYHPLKISLCHPIALKVIRRFTGKKSMTDIVVKVAKDASKPTATAATQHANASITPVNPAKTSEPSSNAQDSNIKPVSSEVKASPKSNKMLKPMVSSFDKYGNSSPVQDTNVEVLDRKLDVDRYTRENLLQYNYKGDLQYTPHGYELKRAIQPKLEKAINKDLPVLEEPDTTSGSAENYVAGVLSVGEAGEVLRPEQTHVVFGTMDSKDSSVIVAGLLSSYKGGKGGGGMSTMFKLSDTQPISGALNKGQYAALQIPPLKAHGADFKENEKATEFINQPDVFPTVEKMYKTSVVYTPRPYNINPDTIDDIEILSQTAACLAPSNTTSGTTPLITENTTTLNNETNSKSNSEIVD